VRTTTVVVAVAGILAGCGGSSDEAARIGTTGMTSTAAATLSTGEWVARADEICLDTSERVLDLDVQTRAQELEALPRGERLEESAALLEEQHVEIARMRRELEQLGLPRTQARDARRIVRDTQAAEDRLAEAIEHFRAGDEDAANQALQRYYTLSLKSAKVAALSDLGFEVCGAGA
jgi:hypothetical protein